MQRFFWGIVVGIAVGLLAFANPGGVRTAVVEKLQGLFGSPPSDNTTKPASIKGSWPHDAPPVIAP